MHLVNQFGRVVEMSEDQASDFLRRGALRKATNSEIAGYQTQRQAMNDKVIHGKTIYFQTVKSSPDGYGMSRDLLIKELKDLDLVLSESFASQKIGLLYNYPYGILSMRTDVRLIYTMFESDRIPEEWADYLAMAEEVLVPSKWCQDVFAKAGIKSTVVPLGYNDNKFTYIERDIAEEAGRPFTFIHYDSFNIRKGFTEVFNAFNEEFAKDEPVRLILKTAQNAVAIPIIKSQYPNIDVITGRLSEDDLAALLKTADCMVYPSRGEGFGITPLESMATGLPAIVPNEHGISEYFNSNYMLEVKAPGRCPGLYTRFKDQDVGEMVVADIGDLKRQMRYAFTHQTQMKDLGRSASQYVKGYTYKQTALKLAEVISKWDAAEIIKRNDSKYLQVEQV
jgi:glycosyltransferase involved in cell wall biosynthesis